MGWCCFIDPVTGEGCDGPAAYSIQGPGDYDDFTHACEQHVKEMTRPGDEAFHLLDEATVAAIKHELDRIKEAKKVDQATMRMRVR